jgi:hypothetical protein
MFCTATLRTTVIVVPDLGYERSQSGNDILVNATVQATLISLQREIDDGATIEEMREIIEGLLYFAQGKRMQ